MTAQCIRKYLGAIVGLLGTIGGFPSPTIAQAPPGSQPLVFPTKPDWDLTALFQAPAQPSQEIQLVVRLGGRQVEVHRADRMISSYPIAVGKPGWETPIGRYQVFLKEKDPVFKNFKTGVVIPAGADNPLGVRWIGFWSDGKTQIGFHGTDQPNLIGQAVSHGCIRMRNQDVVKLFEQVNLGTPVLVQR